MRTDDHGSGSVLLSFFLGGIVGAGLALLFAPQSGTETRRKIKDITDDVKGKSGDYVEQTKEKVTTFVDQGKDTLEGKKSLVKSAIEAGKDAYEKEKEKLLKEKNA
jgi:gas vesicle protein